MKRLVWSLLLFFILAVPAQASTWEEFKHWSGNFLSGTAGTPEEAIQKSQATLEANPTLPVSHINYILTVKLVALINQGNFAEGIKTAQEIIVNQPGVVTGYVFLADLQAALGFYEEAWVTAKLALENSDSSDNILDLREKAREQNMPDTEEAAREKAAQFNEKMKPKVAELEEAAQAPTVAEFFNQHKQSSLASGKTTVAVKGYIVSMIERGDEAQLSLGDGQDGQEKLLSVYMNLEKLLKEMPPFIDQRPVVIFGQLEFTPDSQEPSLQNAYFITPFFLDYEW